MQSCPQSFTWIQRDVKSHQCWLCIHTFTNMLHAYCLTDTDEMNTLGIEWRDISQYSRSFGQCHGAVWTQPCFPVSAYPGLASSSAHWLCTYQVTEKREKNILHLICQCSQQWCEFNFTLFHFQVAPVVLPMTTATTATVTATTTLLLHIQTMRWPALRYTHHCITYTHTAMMALSHIYNMILTRKRKPLVSFEVQDN